LFNDKGEPVRMVGAIRDINELKKAEEEIHRLNKGLERRVAQRTTELESGSTPVGS